MKIKHLLLSLAALLVMISPFPSKAKNTNAETSVYACIVNSDTYLYATQSEEDGIFILPQSYYVKVLSKGNSFCYVQYLENVADFKSVFGYCKTDELLFVDYTPLRPFLYLTFDVKYNIDSSSDMFSTENILTSFSYKCVYYGDYIVGSARYSYVLVNGAYGYIPQTQPVSYEMNTDYLSYIVSLDPPDADENPVGDTENTEDPNAQEKETDNRGIIVICIAVLVIIAAAALVIILKPGRKKQYYYDD